MPMKPITVLALLLAALSPAHAGTMEDAFAGNCPRSVLADEATVRLHCACVRRQIIETTAFPEDREASFALIGPSETLADMAAHEETLAKLPSDIRQAIEGRRQTVTQVIVPLCLFSAATGKVEADGTIKQ
jgi:hypothetical protein